MNDHQNKNGENWQLFHAPGEYTAHREGMYHPKEGRVQVLAVLTILGYQSIFVILF